MEITEFAATFCGQGEYNMVHWNETSGEWEPSGQEYLPDRYILNLPASQTLTELTNPVGNYETAYEGIDYLPSAMSATEIAGTCNWQNLRITHDTKVDWITSHSGDLT